MANQNEISCQSEERGARDAVIREHWTSNIGVILAVSGSAIGLGNFLRFPGQAAANGGGAFLIPYLLALLLLGVPICWAEWSMGRFGGRHGAHSAPAVFGLLGGRPVWRYVGVLGVLIPLAMSLVYIFIAAWCLGYFYAYLTGAMPVEGGSSAAAQVQEAASFYEAFIGIEGNGLWFGPLPVPTIGFWAATFAFNLYLIHGGVARGLERFVRLAMPIMAGCAVLVLIRVLTLGTPDPLLPERNVMNGLGFMWNPDLGALADPAVWLAAAGQVFFSLSAGYGVILNYASFVGKDDDIALSGLTAVATNEVFEVGFGGMITLTASFVFLGSSGAIAAASTGTFGLGFQTLPIVFARLGVLGPWVGGIWFLMLFLAAITSSISMIQPAVTFLREALGMDRRRGAWAVAALCGVGSLVVIYFTDGAVLWSTIDFWIGTFLILVVATIQIICFGWVFGFERGWDELHRGSWMQVPRLFRFVMRYLAPSYLLVVLVAFGITSLPAAVRLVADQRLAQIAVGLVVALATLCLVCVRLGASRWRRLEDALNREVEPPAGASQ